MSREEHERHLRELVHDLRVPVASLAAAVELMEDGDSCVSDAIRASVEHLRSLLKWAEAAYAPSEGGLEFGRVNMIDQVARAAEGLAPVMHAKGISLTVHGDGWALGEATAIARIVVNILGNAVRYAPAGSVISVDVSTDGSLVTCRVQDRGPGFQGTSKAGNEHGWGMGLAVSTQLAQAMGGNLQVLPSNSGATVEVTLVCAADDKSELGIQSVG